jgi:hypothetical protein
MIRGAIAIVIVAITSGCASVTGCTDSCVMGIGPGMKAFDAYGAFSDRQDPCQTRAELGRPEGYRKPVWCGAGTKSTGYITDLKGQPVYIIQQRRP